MIESIQISNVATYDKTHEVMDGLSQFNFVFGSNGTGKTTLSKIIANESAFPSCNVSWKGRTKMQTLVYNEDFVKQNFEQLKGVFTLGKKSKELLKKIADAKRDYDNIVQKLQSLTKTLEGEDGTGGKKGELEELEEEIQKKCWAQKQKHDERLKGAFTGYRNSAVAFKEKVLQEYGHNSAPLFPLIELEKKAETIFGPTPTKENIIQELDAEALLGLEENPILKKRVIGKEDVDIAALINKLDNSDWVRQGRKFYDTTTRICPFCQQKTSEAFAKSLNKYFDETYERDIEAINDLITDYTRESDKLLITINSIITTPSKFLDVKNIEAEKELLNSILTVNKQRLAEKKKEPSGVIELESISSVINSLQQIIKLANSQITKHNKMVDNLSQEKKELTAQVWKYIIENELKVDLDAYKKKKDGLDKAISALNQQIRNANQDKAKKEHEIRELEKQATSIQPTIDGINAILSSFGFQGFWLAKAEDGISYKLIRPDGSDAKDTLSEGERSFVTFLYFYHLLKGSLSEDGITTDRVVVFDDPVSSLDSEVLFVVSSLIKGIFDEVRQGIGYIKQVFVLTHNVYFHREVTFNPKRCDRAMNEETFWVIRKINGKSKIEKYDTNPIKTSYELLWAEVRRSDRSFQTIQNTLRRILENYFKILGGVDPDKICAHFEGRDKQICNSLFSWVNAGSHYAQDDLYLSIDDTTVEVYLRVFKEIFYKTGHSAHYDMMMGETEDTPEKEPKIGEAGV